MQATTLSPGAAVTTLEGERLAVVPNTERQALGQPTPAIPATRSIAVVLDTRRDRVVPQAIIDLARRPGSRIILYDVSTGSRWTTPYQDGDESKRFRNRLLSAPHLQHLGQHGTAEAVTKITSAGIVATGFLANRPGAGDLCDVVQRERIDLVVAIAPLQGKVAHNVQCVRACGATLVEYAAGGHWAVHPPYDSDPGTRQPGQQKSRSRWARVVQRGA